MSKELGLRHILEAQQFSRGWLVEEFFSETRSMVKVVEARGNGLLAGRSVCILFYEPSTRTRISFEQATTKLGATFSSTENAKEFSSAIKGESIKDTIRVVNALGYDAVVLRYHEVGGATEAASVSAIPIINAGDGTGQHPTQALLDLYTISRHFEKIDGLRVALVGDLRNGRTVHSLAYLLGKFEGITIDLVASDDFQIKPDILDYLRRHNVVFRQHADILACAGEIDIVYLTRAQKERMEGKTTNNNHARVAIDEEVLAKLPKDSIIMHPLPRSDDFGELPEKFTNDPRVVIFEQVKNGLYTRMALLKMLLG
ncbi:MAG: Uncharacterized protein G01um10145_114 [Microgenomates group bacterium Gr01-1014_5]|nr:MAG: Uncharacterized protein G01um10145_114 [Microgenomates group bacterium Gr01-1014_5]